MSLFDIILLGILQGLTEFLPVSSSGHLVVANRILETLGSPTVEDLVEVEIVLHLGTLLAVFVFFRREIWKLLTTDRQVIPLLIVGTIPAAIIGIYLKKGMDPDITKLILENPLVAGICFPITAALLLWGTRRPEGEVSYTRLTWQDSLKIGCLQALALLPGISRSGSTIVGGLVVGLKRESAATFAFLLAIPAIGGGGLLEILEAYRRGTTGTPIPNLAAGFVVAFLVGVASLAVLTHFVRKGKLVLFVYYLIPLGIAVIAWQLGDAVWAG